ncbi:MAG: hypothetical protein RI988_1016 [Pseudomonadota bacterium]|jgi:hypothetical protein
MAEIPTIEPTTVNAGDTLSWRRTLDDYPASAGWVLGYVLINGAAKISFSSSASGDDHLVNVPAATSTNWTAGSYDWRARVTKGAEVYTVAEGRITVRPSFAAATQDARSHARKTLEAIEAVIEGRASSEVTYYMIGGRQLRYIPVPELMQLRDRYRAEVAREDAAIAVAAGLPDRRRVFVRFA